MKKSLLLFVALLSCGVALAQMDTTTTKVKRVAQVELPSFKGVNINTNADVKFVYVNTADQCHLTYDLKGSFETKFTYEVTADSILKISEKSIPKRKERSEVTIKYNRLDVVGVAKSRVTFDAPIKQKMIDFNLSSAASLTCEVESYDTKITASGGSFVDLSGSARYISVSASAGSTVVYLGKLSTVAAWVNASQGATVSVKARERLEVKSSMGGLVKYGGNPEVLRAEERLVGGEVMRVEEL